MPSANVPAPEIVGVADRGSKTNSKRFVVTSDGDVDLIWKLFTPVFNNPLESVALLIADLCPLKWFGL